MPSPKHTTLSPRLRKILLREIAAWEAEGLLSPEQIAALRERYAPPPRPSGEQPAAATPKAAFDAPAPTLTQRLLSEASIKIALYLGAFFIIGAALILAALVEVARLPILFALLLGFGLPALALRKRLPQPAFVFYLVASMLLPITARVLTDQLNIGRPRLHGYLAAIFWGAALLWGAGVYLYRSRLFSIFALLSVLAGMVKFSQWLHLESALLLPAVAALCFGGLLWATALRRWQTARLASPLFWFSKALLAVTLLSASGHGLQMWDSATFADQYSLALANALAWSIAAADFALTRRRWGYRFLRFAVLAALLPVPWLTLVGLGVAPDANAQIIIAWLWGALLAALSLPLERASAETCREYAFPVLLASAAAFLGALSLPFVRDPIVALPIFLTLGGISLVYAAANLLRPRFWVWQAALLAAVGAFLTFFELPFMESIPVFAGYKLTGIGLALLLPDLLADPRRGGRVWRWPPRGLGALISIWSALYLLAVGRHHPAEAALIFGLYTIFGIAYALAWGRAALGGLATTALVFGLFFALRAVDYPLWVWPLTVLAALYYLLGQGLSRRAALRPWGNLLRFSALALAALLALSAPLEDSGAWVSLWIALNASLYALEAWRTRNVWLGFPAALIYLIAYALLLVHLDVTQPQFYAVGAAALGLVMHYLLTRSGNRTAAFLTGMLSQLALLSTTYVQMVAEMQFIYFAVLFTQALAVLIYGVVIRSRSLVGTPIAFVVLAVLTVAANILQGILSALLVGCTGIVLILFGTLALLLRERFSALRAHWRRWNP